MKKLFQKLIGIQRSVLVLSLASVILFAIGAFASTQNFQALSARVIQFVPSPQNQPAPTPGWTIEQKITEGLALLKDVNLSVGQNDISYSETRVGQDSKGNMVSSGRTFKEPEKQMALAVLNADTGKLKKIFVTQKGEDLLAPPGWDIQILQRPNGVRWNYWNTAFHIASSSPEVVVADVYPATTETRVRVRQGRRWVYETQQNVEQVPYVPYSPDLEVLAGANLIRDGRNHIASMVAAALDDLRKKEVQSKAAPGQLAANVFQNRSQYFLHVPILENTDPIEFLLDPAGTVQRTEILIGANLGQSSDHTCNGANACGWVQFTPGTYSDIVKAYPAAKLIHDFDSGAIDHLNSMEAAILLYDQNLSNLIKQNDPSIVNDPKLEEYLAAAYNGGSVRVNNTIDAALTSAVQDWMDALTTKKGGLFPETETYLVKLRYLRSQNLP